MLRRRHALALATTGLALPWAGARAQAFPQDRPIRAVVNFPPGGTVDTVARLVAPVLSEKLGRQVVVENRGGASGLIGAEAVVRSAPDGHTLLFALSTHAVNPHMVPRMPFDTLADFAPVGFIGGAPVLMAAHPSAPFRTLADVIAAGRIGEGPHYGTIGNGSTGHLMMAQLQTLTGARFTHVPFRGGGPAVQAALGGQVPLVITSTVAVGPHVAAGSLRGVALSGAERSPVHPTVPTVAEQGFPGFSADSWVGVLAPARTPDAIVARINADLAATLADPGVRERLAGIGMTPRAMAPAEFGAFVASEYERWGKVVREHRIVSD
ncbi:Bug family tripartite tricarboxylate transporter substrate binding protein [Falsiroseomonas stagni]|uniref:Tripartite-type tricarboxylate transporter, receptor component TctC n=1 Tax=Falsiroseomonas stagni DSM 19981 TaxID=1123062 RepID=A0A1I4EEL6_9PROT|nr:tripartite tricarboxylate transporter substrate binding protein [Falsiroseomonas stagni]SFL02806.1 Tripartite-type tricarboxylate transporter, receptor component TctC [Falsiroseomonas stagni DSM 19981]